MIWNPPRSHRLISELIWIKKRIWLKKCNYFRTHLIKLVSCLKQQQERAGKRRQLQRAQTQIDQRNWATVVRRLSKTVEKVWVLNPLTGKSVGVRLPTSPTGAMTLLLEHDYNKKEKYPMTVILASIISILEVLLKLKKHLYMLGGYIYNNVSDVLFIWLVSKIWQSVRWFKLSNWCGEVKLHFVMWSVTSQVTTIKH